MSYPRAAFTTGGPPGKTWLIPFTMTLKCDRQALDRRQTGHRPQNRRHHRHRAQQLLDPRRAGRHRNIGAADLLEGAHAAAGGVQEPHVGKAPIVSHTLRVAALVADGSIGSTAAHGKVAGVQDHLAPIERCGADHGVGRHEGCQFAVLIGCAAGQTANFSERLQIRNRCDALPHRQLAAPSLPGNAGLAAHLVRQRLALMEFVDFRLPTHGRLLSSYALGGVGTTLAAMD